MILKAKQYIDSYKSICEQSVQSLKKKYGVTPTIACIMVGDNPASEVYVRNKHKMAKEMGLNAFTTKFTEDCEQQDVINYIEHLNNDKNVHGVIVQMPLPPHLDPFVIINHINPDKDVDGFTDKNMAITLMEGSYENHLAPATPKGIMELLKYYEIDVEGKNVVILGRSRTVTKPLQAMLIAKNATVTTCHSKTKDVDQHTCLADIIITAVGKPNTIDYDSVSLNKVTIIDVGINRDDNGKLCGDMDPKLPESANVDYSPVPGGVGPMTVVTLITNTILAYKKLYGENN